MFAHADIAIIDALVILINAVSCDYRSALLIPRISNVEKRIVSSSSSSSSSFLSPCCFRLYSNRGLEFPPPPLRLHGKRLRQRLQLERPGQSPTMPDVQLHFANRTRTHRVCHESEGEDRNSFSRNLCSSRMRKKKKGEEEENK